MTEDLTMRRLPVNESLGFPQTLYVVEDDIVYRMTYRFNGYDESFVMTIVRSSDDKIMAIGKISEGGRLVAKDPDYGTPVFGLYGYSIDEDNLIIWVIGETERNDATFQSVFAT